MDGSVDTKKSVRGLFILHIFNTEKRKKVITWHAREKEKAAKKEKVNKESNMRETRARP